MPGAVGGAINRWCLGYLFVDSAAAQVGEETQSKQEDPADDDHYGE